MDKKQLRIIFWKYLHWTAESMGSFTDGTWCLVLLQAWSFSLSGWAGSHWSVLVAWDRWPWSVLVAAPKLCWCDKGSEAHWDWAGFSWWWNSDLLFLCTQFPDYFVHILFFSNGPSLALSFSQPPALFGWNALLLLKTSSLTHWPLPWLGA